MHDYSQSAAKLRKISHIRKRTRNINNELVVRKYFQKRRHYDVKPPKEELTKKIAHLANNQGYTWTTDAIFCETKQEVLHYESLGASTVEMEASSLFACAKKRNVKASAIFVISDLLNGNDDDYVDKITADVYESYLKLIPKE